VPEAAELALARVEELRGRMLEGQVLEQFSLPVSRSTCVSSALRSK
jgi:hypothetical protein